MSTAWSINFLKANELKMSKEKVVWNLPPLALLK